ncbi:CopG family transcriptional regulator [Actinokineospora sp. UTMC 2448]|uniref:CopG family transcriptional regulator n=1 Tax=Actinokineospora sp. UTMC 2448 TaxID=2268449 RepID=UPI0021648C63|nr:CopG family transcriptional regulator [Actinokineospora sp. UTMC 2448]UVS77059.1 hypothetical protein Actkin_00761 [Actinokineospora sp. UTMC 2448]
MDITLRLTEEQERALALLAEAGGVSEHDAAVRAISEAARVREERVRALSRSGRERYARLLDRLGR